MYEVLSPIYHKDGYMTIRGRKITNYRIEWEVVGKADSIEDAKKKGFKTPILNVALHKEDLDAERAIAQALAQLY